MPLRTPARLLLTAALLLVGLSAQAGASTLVPASTKLHQRQLGTDCGAASNTALSLTAGGSSELGCGFIGGGPFGEAFHTAGEDFGKTYSTQGEVAKQILDASRNVTGVVRVVPYVALNSTQGSGAGNITVDVTLTVERANGQTDVIGSSSKTVLTTPNASHQNITYDLDIPDALDKVTVTDLHLHVNIRGIHAAHGFNELRGNSNFVLPTFVVQP